MRRAAPARHRAHRRRVEQLEARRASGLRRLAPLTDEEWLDGCRPWTDEELRLPLAERRLTDEAFIG